MTEIAAPISVRRTVSFSQAVYSGRTQVEDAVAILVHDEAEMLEAFKKREIAVFVDPGAGIVKSLKPAALIDAIMAKKNSGTTLSDASVVIGTGPGFRSGVDCHAVIETQRGHNLGRVITDGSAAPNTGVPGEIGGFSLERLLRAPAEGVFEEISSISIGDTVKKRDVIALVRNANKDGAAEYPVTAEISGTLRGLLSSGIVVKRGMKIGDIDPRCERSHCFTVSDKALAVGGGVLEALLRFHNH
jgi:xanthine dehydrogenase accessory factor